MNWEVDTKRDINDLNFRNPVRFEKKPISRFIIISGLVHILTASAILINNHIPQKHVDKELVVVDFETSSEINSAPEEAPIPQVAMPSQPAVTEALAEEPVAKELPVIQPVPEPTSKPTVVLKSQPKASAPEAVKSATLATIDDIKTPQLDDNPETQTNPVTAAFVQEDLDQDLNEVDQENAKQLEVAASEIKQEADQVENALTETSEKQELKIQQENEKAAAILAARAEQLKKEQEAYRLAAEKAATEASKTAGNDVKNAGPGQQSTEVRALEQLRQMPGNPKPLYDQEERLKGHQGVIVFQAFVTQDGRLTDFKLLKSTGHRNLDAKTLKALKQWKFYPGQEGWVELPFDWNLKGGPQELPALLRRRVGQGP